MDVATSMSEWLYECVCTRARACIESVIGYYQAWDFFTEAGSSANKVEMLITACVAFDCIRQYVCSLLDSLDPHGPPSARQLYPVCESHQRQGALRKQNRRPGRDR